MLMTKKSDIAGTALGIIQRPVYTAAPRL